MFMRVWGIILCLAISILISGCGDDNVTESKLIKKTLIMGTMADFPPFEFIKDKKVRGFDIDLAHIIARKLGYSVYIKNMDLHDLIPALRTGKVDFVMSGLTVTPERKELVDFSIQYYTPQFAMLYRRDKPIKSYRDIDNSVIGVSLGSTMESFLNKQKDLNVISNVTLVPLVRSSAAVQELKLGRLDGVFLEEAQAKIYMNRHNDMEYTLFPSGGQGYAVAFPKGSELLDQFNEVLISLRDSGELDSLKEKWLF
jgi:polar amino acid transport system substrate-binding protein